MQLIPRYLVNNRTTVVINDSGFTTEYRPVYTRNLKVYRGIDNNLEFKILNADQKPISLTSKTVKLVAFDQANNQILSETGSNHGTIKGLTTITVSENDLLSVKDQFLKYAVHVEDTNQNKTLTYLIYSSFCFVLRSNFINIASCHLLTTQATPVHLSTKDIALVKLSTNLNIPIFWKFR